MMHVPYKGSSLMMTDIVSGNVNVGFSAISTALGLIESGKVKVLAVAASERSPILPNVPTLGETVLGYTANVWFCLSAQIGRASCRERVCQYVYISVVACEL